MGVTPTYALPYPGPTDNVDVAGDIQLLANELDVVIGDLALPTAFESVDTAITNGTTTSVTFVNTLTTSGIRGVAFSAPASGKVDVILSCGGFNSNVGEYTLVSAEVRSGSILGSGTVAKASDENCCSQVQSTVASGAGQHALVVQVSGLTPHASYNACMTYRRTLGTGSFNRRRIKVNPLSA